jgi:hypothetical protein
MRVDLCQQLGGILSVIEVTQGGGTRGCPNPTCMIRVLCKPPNGSRDGSNIFLRHQEPVLAVPDHVSCPPDN